ncbi:MAG: hypothetical protein GY720_04595 [bacterium]|nr:hypothetical protein [bacterium]
MTDRMRWITTTLVALAVVIVTTFVLTRDSGDCNWDEATTREGKCVPCTNFENVSPENPCWVEVGEL